MTPIAVSGKGEASAWVMRFLGGIRPGGRILDVACGRGRHMRAALAAGYHVTGIDRNLSGVAELADSDHVKLVEADLENGRPATFSGEKFDGVIVTNYLWRPLLPEIIASVAKDGVLIYETFGVGNERYGKPSNPDFLLRPGELIETVRPDLIPIAYEHVTEPGPPARVKQRLCAAGAGHRWLTMPPEHN